jgi:hypothetical protein
MDKKPLMRARPPANLGGMKRLPALLGAWLLAAPLLAAEKSDHARLRLPWDALKNVLRIDQDRVRLSAEEFDALIKRTSRKNPPAHVVADGDVLLSRAEFTRLIQSLVPPAEPAATVFAPKAVYRGRLLKNSAAVEATLHVEMPEKPAAPIVWDAFPAQAAFQSIVLDGKPALAAVRNGRLYITLTDAGRAPVGFAFFRAGSGRDRGTDPGASAGEHAHHRMDLRGAGAEFGHRRARGAPPELSAAPGGTRVRALLPPTSWVTMAWNPLAPDRAKGPAQVYAVVDHLVSVEEDAVRATAHVALDVLQNTINEALLVPPAGFAVLDVRGEAVKDWQERADPARLAVSLKVRAQGTRRLFRDIGTRAPRGKVHHHLRRPDGPGRPTPTGAPRRGVEKRRGTAGPGHWRARTQGPFPRTAGRPCRPRRPACVRLPASRRAPVPVADALAPRDRRPCPSPSSIAWRAPR